MVSKNQIKRITSLHQKKYRTASGLFIAEGRKVISELLRAGFSLDVLFVSSDAFPDVPAEKRFSATEADLRKMSALSAASDCLAVFAMKPEIPLREEGLIVALDDIRDPGNLGTIIRLCDWFGVTGIVCSEATADLYNPKVVQATMGSLARVSVHYLDLPEFLSRTQLPVFGTFMDGKNVYKTELPSNAILLMGNEANGISQAAEKRCIHRISIPRFGNTQLTESLNVATATAIFLSEWRRNA